MSQISENLRDLTVFQDLNIQTSCPIIFDTLKTRDSPIIFSTWKLYQTRKHLAKIRKIKILSRVRKFAPPLPSSYEGIVNFSFLGHKIPEKSSRILPSPQNSSNSGHRRNRKPKSRSTITSFSIILTPGYPTEIYSAYKLGRTKKKASRQDANNQQTTRYIPWHQPGDIK